MDWIGFDGPTSMYPSDWMDLGLSSWEIKNCPWWLDYPKNQVPNTEVDLYATHEARAKRQGITPPPIGSTSRPQPKNPLPQIDTQARRPLDFEDVQPSPMSENTLSIHGSASDEGKIMSIEFFSFLNGLTMYNTCFVETIMTFL